MSTRDPQRRPLDALILRLVEPLIRWTRNYPASVVSQAADGTLDVQVDPPSGLSASKPVGITQVAIMGLPGVTVKVRPGAMVLLGFQDGDRSRPIATLFAPDSLSEIKVTAALKVTVDAPAIDLGDAFGAVLREGDTVSIPGPGGGAAGPVTLSGPLRSKVKA
jgi:hypothetical protein